MIIFLWLKVKVYVHTAGLHWAYLWYFCASLWFVVSFMVWIELDFTSVLTRWQWTLSSLPHWSLKTLLRTYGELSVRMLKHHLTNQSAHLHANSDAKCMCMCVCVCRWWCGCVIKCTCCMQTRCQRQTVFFRIDYGCIKQTLVRFGYIRMTA